MSVFFHKVKSKSILISSFILIILSVEIYAVINQAMQMIESVGYISSGNLNSPFGSNLNGNFLGNETFSYLKSEKFSPLMFFLVLFSIHIQYSYKKDSVERFKSLTSP